jgi:ADP-ribose pyrophosphatase YjhB (NUDIX family)
VTALLRAAEVALRLADECDATETTQGFIDATSLRLLASHARTTAVPRICVAALVTDSAGRLALVRTKRGWELPGGRMEIGERWRDALRRELREEIGVEVRLSDEQPLVFDGMPVNGAQYQSVILVARGLAEGDLQPAAGDAVHEARWFAWLDVPTGALSAIATADVVRRWLAEAWCAARGISSGPLRGARSSGT